MPTATKLETPAADVRSFVNSLSCGVPRDPASGPVVVVGSASEDSYRATCEMLAAEILRDVTNSVALLRHVCGARRMPAEAINHLDRASFTLDRAIHHGNGGPAVSAADPHAYVCPECGKRFNDPETLGTPWSCPDDATTIVYQPRPSSRR